MRRWRRSVHVAAASRPNRIVISTGLVISMVLFNAISPDHRSGRGETGRGSRGRCVVCERRLFVRFAGSSLYELPSALALLLTFVLVLVNALVRALWKLGAALSKPRARMTTRSAYSAISAPS